MTRREWISSLPLGMALFDQAKEAPAQPASDPAKIAATAMRTFGVRLLREMAGRQPRQNVFISPLSVFLALQMAENGAAGSTRTAMREALALPDLNPQALNASTEALVSSLKSRNADALNIANGLWADRRFTLNRDYVKLCTALFNARAETLDFRDPGAAAEINRWVSDATHSKIPQIVSADAIVNAALILTNAVYFAAAWRTEFPPSQTQTAAFHLSGGQQKNLPMMHHARVAAGYRAGSNFQGAVLSYKESSLFLYALLPNPGTTTEQVLGSLDPQQLNPPVAGFELDIKLPRFNLDFSASLNDFLTQMGMEVAFRYPQADFSPMGSRKFYISDVIHKTRLEVDEKGTVAAAATAVTVTAAAMVRREVKTLVFDRPFLVLIGDSQTGALLFAGVIENP